VHFHIALMPGLPARRWIADGSNPPGQADDDVRGTDGWTDVVQITVEDRTVDIPIRCWETPRVFKGPFPQGQGRWC